MRRPAAADALGQEVHADATLRWRAPPVAFTDPWGTLFYRDGDPSPIPMAARASRHLSREDKELVERSIRAGRFEDLDDFEEFAVRQAISLLLLEELQELRAARGGKRLSAARIQREIRRVRRELAREYGIA